MKLKEVIPFQSTPLFFQYLDVAMTQRIRALSGTPSNAKMQQVFCMKYGERTLVPAIEEYFELRGLDITKPTSAIYTSIMDMAILDWNKYYKLWDNVVLAEYNPLDNYNGTTTTTNEYASGYENEYDSSLKTTLGTKTVQTDNRNNTLRHDTNTKQTITNLDTQNRLQGFNSVSDSNTTGIKINGVTDNKYDGTDVSEDTGTTEVANSGDNNQLHTGLDEQRHTGKDTFTEVKHGNLGIRSSQEMMTQEIEFRMWNFFDTLFKDIASAISLHIY